MPNLRPFRDYDEKDVINLYALSGATLPLNKGTIVKIEGTKGFRHDLEPIEMLGSFGDFTTSNTVLQRYGVTPKVTVAGTGDYPLGMTLFDVRELDENGLPLKYNPRKAAEMEAVLSGQAVPVVTRGTFLYSGVTGTITPGAPAWLGANGTIVTGFQGYNLPGQTGVLPQVKVGKFLGATGTDGACLIWFNIGN